VTARGANATNPVLRVFHAQLARSSEESAYRSKCPFCEQGMFMIFRHETSLRLRRRDRCLHCLQKVEYAEDTINGEALVGDDGS
jgi:hypothetical protein